MFASKPVRTSSSSFTPHIEGVRIWLASQQESQRIRETEYPLTHRSVWQDIIYQKRSALHHPSGTTTGAKAASFATAQYSGTVDITDKILNVGIVMIGNSVAAFVISNLAPEASTTTFSSCTITRASPQESGGSMVSTIFASNTVCTRRHDTDAAKPSGCRH